MNPMYLLTQIWFNLGIYVGIKRPSEYNASNTKKGPGRKHRQGKAKVQDETNT